MHKGLQDVCTTTNLVIPMPLQGIATTMNHARITSLVQPMPTKQQGATVQPTHCREHHAHCNVATCSLQCDYLLIAMSQPAHCSLQ
jgi:hypothetical protein